MSDAEIAELCRTHRGDPFYDSVSSVLAKLDRIRTATGMVCHTDPDECKGCGFMSLTSEEAVAELKAEWAGFKKLYLEMKAERDELREVAAAFLDTRPIQRWAEHIGKPGDEFPTPGCRCYSCRTLIHNAANKQLAELLAKTSP